MKLIEVIVVVLIVGVLALSLGSSCMGDADGARTALQGMGFKDVKLEDPKWLFNGCDKNERNNPFTATNQTGQRVHGIVCCGSLLSFKGCTVRF